MNASPLRVSSTKHAFKSFSLLIHYNYKHIMKFYVSGTARSSDF
jgi:hypothetical protein